MVAQKDKGGTQEPEPDVQVSYFGTYYYAKWYEIVATVFGVLLALLSGGGVCFILIIFGELSTAVVQRTTFRENTTSYLPLLRAFGGGDILTNAPYQVSIDALMQDGAAMGKGMAVSVAICIFLCYVAVTFINWSALRQARRIRNLFFEAVLRQEMSWYDTDTTFNLASRMNDDLTKIKNGMGEKLVLMANLVGTAVISFCQSFPLGWELSLACATVMPLSIISTILLTNYQTKSTIQEMNSYSLAGKQAEEVLKSVKTIVAFGGEEKEVSRYRRLLEPAERHGRRRGIFSGLGSGFNWVLTYSLNAIGLAYGARLVVEDMYKPADEKRYVIGSVFSILSSIFIATESLTFCVPHSETFTEAKAAATNIFKIMKQVPKIDGFGNAGLSPRRIKGEITLEDIHFSYPSRPDVKVLKGFSLHIKAGECVALVGSSGCGKSTVLQLVQRMYDPHSGVVKLDGKDIKSLNTNWLRTSMGVVGQEPVLFSGTIYENIALGVSEASREEVIRVAEMAYAHEFISMLPEGYETVIGERGASLSGGQKQRIAIARSLLREPVVLLLDEATSALDSHSERQVQAALDRAAEGRTTLIVSHRLSTIYNADRIVCMDQGVIIEQGKHQELLEKKGAYWKLVTVTGDQVTEIIETTVPEEEKENDDNESIPPVRTEVKRRSTRRKYSARRGSQDWMASRNSISSVVSMNMKNFSYNCDENEEEENENEEVKTVSSWDLVKENSPEWVYILVGSIAAFAQGATFPVFALVFGKAIGIFQTKDTSEVAYRADLFCGFIVLVAVVAGVAMFLQSAMFTTAGLKMTSRLRIKYFRSLLNMEMAYFDDENNAVGALCARLTGDTAAVQGATGIRIGLILQGISSVLVGFILAMVYNWKLTLVGTAFIPLMVGSIVFEGKFTTKCSQTETMLMEKASALATEAVISIRTVQSLSVEKHFIAKFQEVLVDSMSSLAKQLRFRGLVLGLGLYVPFLAYCSTMIYGIYLIAYEEVPYEVVLLVTQSSMFGAYMLAQSLVYAPSFNAAKDCGTRILNTINRVPKVRDEDDVKDKSDWVATGNFGIKDVTFSYPTRPNQRILRGITLKVEAGKTVALVGSSGCGKSTILQLLQRFYDPVSGNIELDSHDIHYEMTLSKLRRQLGVVQQEPILFDRSIAENIAYGDNKRKVSTHEIIAAAKAANIHSFIISLPKGYDTKLGSGGAQLSGGQKQRVCIARALIRSPRLLLLDEATSALDASSQKVVSDALDAAAKGRTCITIAHRLSTIKDADIICVVDKGRIIEHGTHQELLSMRSHYWKMCQGPVVQ